MPTVAGVSESGNWTANTGSTTADLPEVESGQLLLAGTFARLASQTINLPSASPGTWTRISNDDVTQVNSTGEIAGKVAGGSETAPTLSTSAVAPQGQGGILIVVDDWSGDLGAILVANDGGANNTLVAPSIDDAPDGSLVLRWFFNADNNTISTPPAGTQVFTELVPNLGRLALHVYATTQTGAGATGTATLIASGSDGWLTFTVVIPPATGEEEPETADLAGTLPAVTGVFAATASADIDLAGTLPAVTGTFAAQATAGAALAGTLPAVTGSFTATGGVVADLAGTLPAVAGSFTATASADASLAATLPALTGSFAASEPGVAPTRAAMTAAVAATRTSSPSVTGVRTAAVAATAATTQASGVD